MNTWEKILDFLNQGFFYGALTAFLICLGLWFYNGGPRRMFRLDLRKKDQEIAEREKQLQTLREQLHTQMEINHAGTEALRKEKNELAEQVKNLEISVATLQQKPGKAERRQLALYQASLDRLFAEAPGFSSAWQASLAKSEAEMSKQEQGIGGFLRTFVSRALPGSPATDEEVETVTSLEDRATTAEEFTEGNKAKAEGAEGAQEANKS